MNSDMLTLIDQAAKDGHLTGDSPANLRSWLTRECVSEYQLRITELIRAGNWQKLDAMFWTTIPCADSAIVRSLIVAGPISPIGPRRPPVPNGMAVQNIASSFCQLPARMSSVIRS